MAEKDADSGRADGWVPPRPPSYASAWADPDRATPVTAPPANSPAQTRSPTPSPSPSPSHDRRGARPGVLAGFWARITLGRRILLSYLGLAAVIVLVTGVGAALQPTYGSLTPWQGIHVDDLRSAPASSAWGLDLASTLAPGSPPECLRFTGTDIGQDLVAVRADSAWTYGFSEDTVCSVVPAGFRSRVAVLDTARGAIRWVHDVAADLSTNEGVSITSTTLTSAGSRLLVRANTASQALIESLSLGTGQVLESTGPLTWSQDDRFTTSGDVVATGSLSRDALTFEYELRSSNDLSHVVWRGAGNETATMIALHDRLLLGGAGTMQIPLASGIASPWGGPVNTSLGYAVRHDVVFAPKTVGTGVTAKPTGGFSAVDRTGHVIWSSKLDLRGSYSLTRSCLAVTNHSGDRLTCLDYATGRQLWSDDIGAFSYAGSALGQRSDDIYAISTTDHARVLAIDGATGREKFSADVPSGSYVVAAGHTVAYALAYGVNGSRSSVIALDLSTGARLWTHASQLQLSLWGGHLIDIGMDGLARRLDR